MKIRLRAALTSVAALTVGAALTGISPSTAGAAVNPSKATSAAAFGGMAGLVKAAKKEGTLNVITLPADWANYGNIIKDFSKKYGIKVNSENPDGTSADEITAVQTEKGQSRAPDVLDMGTSFAISAAQQGLLAPYKVQSWSRDPVHGQGLQRGLVRRLRRVRRHRLQLQGGQGGSHLVQEPPQPDLQEPDRSQRQPDPGRCGVRRRLRGGPGQRRIVQQHRSRHRLLQEALRRGELRAGDGRRDTRSRAGRRRS